MAYMVINFPKDGPGDYFIKYTLDGRASGTLKEGGLDIE
jgi:hypothetical protein